MVDSSKYTSRQIKWVNVTRLDCFRETRQNFMAPLFCKLSPAVRSALFWMFSTLFYTLFVQRRFGAFLAIKVFSFSLLAPQSHFANFCLLLCCAKVVSSLIRILSQRTVHPLDFLYKMGSTAPACSNERSSLFIRCHCKT